MNLQIYNTVKKSIQDHTFQTKVISKITANTDTEFIIHSQRYGIH